MYTNITQLESNSDIIID